MQRRHPFIGGGVDRIAGQRAGNPSGIAGRAGDLGVDVSAVREHQIQKRGVDGCAARPDTAGTAAPRRVVGPAGDAGGIQPWRQAHAVDIRIGALLQQQPRDIGVVVDQRAQQRRRAGAEERIVEPPALIARPSHVELCIGVDAGRQQQVDHLHG